MPLSDVKIRAAKAGPKTQKLFDGHGLYLEISPSGGKHWRLKYRHNGKEGKLSFGAYPAVGLARARELRDMARAALAEGKNPAEKRAKELVFQEAAFEFLEKQHGTITENHFTQLKRLVEKWLLPHLGNVPITKLTPRLVLDAAQAAEDAGYVATAHLALATAGRITSYARLRGYCEHSAGSGLSGALRKHATKHRAAITDPPGVGKLLRDIYGVAPI
jgi:integrase